ncbi:caspase family protein [Nitrospira sp. Kam-Ns4a]
MRQALLSGLLLGGVTAVLAFPPAAADFSQPDAYAVVIGISQYREEVIPKVAYAVKDAEAMAKLLETQTGIPKSHIRLLTDAKATLSDLRYALGPWLQRRVKPPSIVYVYYAGHGTPNVQIQSGSIVPWDGLPDYPDGLYPLKELEETLGKLPASNVLVFLDSCFSGAAGRSVLATGARPMGLSLEHSLLAAGKVVVLAASTGDQISSDYDKARHGLFTYALLTGLQGAADQDHDGVVTVRELYPYVRKQVAETAVEELNREQTPVLLPGKELLGARAALPVARVAPAAPAMPSAPTLLLSPSKDVDVSVYEHLDTLAKLGPSSGSSRGRRSGPLRATAASQRRGVSPRWRSSSRTFPRTPPHGAEAEALKQQIQQEIQIAKVPASAAPQQAGREITGRDGAPMVLIPAGTFWMGSTEDEVERVVDECQRVVGKYEDESECRGLISAELPRHRVTLDAFYLDVYEVTNRLFERFVSATGYQTTAERESTAVAFVGGKGWQEVRGASWRQPEGGPDGVRLELAGASGRLRLLARRGGLLPLGGEAAADRGRMGICGPGRGPTAEPGRQDRVPLCPGRSEVTLWAVALSPCES